MIGREEMEMMKRGAYLINASRSAIVEEEALRKALTEGRLAGAALDVFEVEPPGGTGLTRLWNVVCTPHVGSASVAPRRQRAHQHAVRTSKMDGTFTGCIASTSPDQYIYDLPRRGSVNSFMMGRFSVSGF